MHGNPWHPNVLTCAVDDKRFADSDGSKLCETHPIDATVLDEDRSTNSQKGPK